MTSLTDQVGSKTTFTFDKRGLLTGSTDPLNKSTSLSYYDDGKVHTITDRKSRITTFTYTPTGKTDTVTYQSGATVAYTYNQNDNLSKMQDAIGATSYTYDAANRLISSTDPHGFGISYLRDANGNITRITYPGNKTVSYTYDALNRFKTVTIDWLAKTATYNYDDAGRMTDLSQFNNTYTQYTYDDANRLTALENLSSGGGTIAGYNFSLDANGNRTNVSQTVPLGLSLPETDTAYTYNTKKNRLLQAGTTDFTYDNEGQLASQTGAAYTFDDAHRLISMTADTVTDTYLYDGAGHRLEATGNSVATRYIYDTSGNLLAEADGSDVIQRYYIYGDGLLAVVTSTGALYCYHYDGTGHTVALTDAAANVVNTYVYAPFGLVADEQEGVSQPFKYAGKFGIMAEPNGLYYMRARYYDPNVGRFISEDPSGFEGGDVNLMAYVQNNPVNFVDPLGLIGRRDSAVVTILPQMLYDPYSNKWPTREPGPGLSNDFVYGPPGGGGIAIGIAGWKGLMLSGEYAITLAYLGAHGTIAAGRAAMNFAAANPDKIGAASNFIEAALPGVPKANWSGVGGSALNYAIGWSESAGSNGKKY